MSAGQDMTTATAKRKLRTKRKTVCVLICSGKNPMMPVEEFDISQKEQCRANDSHLFSPFHWLNRNGLPKRSRLAMHTK